MISRKLILQHSRPALEGDLFNRSGASLQTTVDSYPAYVIAESFRTVLSALLRSDEVPPKTIVVTSAVTHEGKTTVSTNLAIARAQQGKRVLLVDADLRKGSVSRALGLAQATGLTEILATLQNEAPAQNSQAAAAAIVPAPHVPNLFILPAGSVGPHGPEVMSAEGIRNLIAEWRENFDQIVIDTPPVLLIADALQVAPEADAVVLIVRSGYTTQDAFHRALEVLDLVNAPVRGILLNGVDVKSPDLYYLREYGYTNAIVS